MGIARALVVDPQIIFADEPTGNLDSKTTMEVLRLMQRIVREQKQTLVMVTHGIPGFLRRPQDPDRGREDHGHRDRGPVSLR